MYLLPVAVLPVPKAKPLHPPPGPVQAVSGHLGTAFYKQPDYCTHLDPGRFLGGPGHSGRRRAIVTQASSKAHKDTL